MTIVKIHNAVKRKKNELVVICFTSLIDESSIEREYSALEAIADSFEKVFVSLDELNLPLKGGIKHVRAWELFNKLAI